MADIRDVLFAGIGGRKVTASVVTDEAGVITDVETATGVAVDFGLTVTDAAVTGDWVAAGAPVMTVVGSPKQIALAEERLVGVMAKPSGIATAARRFVERAGPGLRVVAGAWKKLPADQKDMVRSAVAVGGVDIRISPPPFVYLDKNYVTMLGGVRNALTAADLPGHLRVIQVGGKSADITVEACEAARWGADVVFVDTGRSADVEVVAARLQEHGLRDVVTLAFAGNVKLDDLDVLHRMDVDIVDVGRAIVDAPLLDMHVEVIELDGG